MRQMSAGKMLYLFRVSDGYSRDPKGFRMSALENGARKHLDVYLPERLVHHDSHAVNFLTKANQCGIYDHRPYLCREHSTEDCEYTGEDFGFSEHFKSYDELLTYIKENYNFRFKQPLTGVAPNIL